MPEEQPAMMEIVPVGAIVLTLREFGLCGGVPELRLGRGEGGLVGPRIDDKEQIALLDDLPIGEVDLR